MPLYEYECTSCHAKAERILSFNSASETQYCRECGGQLRQMISRPASFKVGKYGKGNR